MLHPPPGPQAPAHNSKPTNQSASRWRPERTNKGTTPGDGQLAFDAKSGLSLYLFSATRPCSHHLWLAGSHMPPLARFWSPQTLRPPRVPRLCFRTPVPLQAPPQPAMTVAAATAALVTDVAFHIDNCAHVVAAAIVRPHLAHCRPGRRHRRRYRSPCRSSHPRRHLPRLLRRFRHRPWRH